MTNTNDDFEMIAGKLCLKDGRKLRVPVTMRDSKPKTHLHDGRGGAAGHRPGWVIPADGGPNAMERQAAHDAYAQYLETAYKGDAPPAGAYPLSSGEGTACTINGAPGTLVKEGGWLVCKPTSQDARPKNDPEEDDPDGDPPPRRRRRYQQFDPQGRASGSIVEEDHQTAMSKLYDALDYELTQAWRNPR